MKLYRNHPKPNRRLCAVATLLVFVASLAAAQTPIGTAFTYQGRLSDQGQPATGGYDFVFTLYDAASGGVAVGTSQTLNNVGVTDGLFTVELDFGATAFVGAARWLDITVRRGASVDPYTPLTPRQRLTPAPYALYGATTDDFGSGLMWAWPGSGLVTLNNTELDADNAAGQPRAAIYVGDDDAGGVETLGPNGLVNTALTALAAAPNHGYVAAADSRGLTQAGLYAASTGEGALSLWGPGDSLNVDLSAASANADLGYIGVGDTRGEMQSVLGVFPSGEGGLTTWGPNDQINVDISAELDDANRGFMGVADAGGVIQAGCYVDSSGDGIVFGDYKYFVADHPDRPDAKIVYVSLEGPEAGIYHRGVARLDKGHAVVTLPEHFRAVANLKTLTVQLTPASFESNGVAFQILDDGRIELGELDGGLGDYDVHYLVHAVRAGSEDHQPVVSTPAFLNRFTRPRSR